MTDEAFERVPVAEWDRLADRLGAFDADVTETEAGLTLERGSARFHVARDGRIEAGMPLHEFDGRVDALLLDPEGGRLRIADGVDYEFRLP